MLTIRSIFDCIEWRITSILSNRLVGGLSESTISIQNFIRFSTVNSCKRIYSLIDWTLKQHTLTENDKVVLCCTYSKVYTKLNILYCGR